MNQSSYSGDLTDSCSVAGFLQERGFSPDVASAKAGTFARNASALARVTAGSGRKVHAYYVPGRVEVLGKHTDYAGGSSIVMAAERGFCLVASPREDALVAITDTGRDDTVRFEIGPELKPLAGRWPNFPMTVARRIARNFPGANKGADIVLSSDLPSAAGMSSSSALLIASFFALADSNELWSHPAFPAELDGRLNLAGYLGTVENGQSYGDLQGDSGVGTFGGSEDHTAILCSGTGRLHRYAYCPARFEEALPLPEDLIFVIASSGVIADKTGDAREKYNRASRLAGMLTELWNRRTGAGAPHVAAILRDSMDNLGRLRELIAAETGEISKLLSNRLEHFVTENETVIPAVTEALRQGNLQRLGEAADLSQKAAGELLGNQTPETSFLAASARELGAVAASGFGGGFGGGVWAMVALEESERFLSDWRDRYTAEYPEPATRSEFFVTNPGHPMFRLV